MLFRYFLGDIVSRETVYQANNSIVNAADAVWTFGQISNGVFAEIKMKQQLGGEVRHYRIVPGDPIAFRRILPVKLEYEDNLDIYKEEIST